MVFSSFLFIFGFLPVALIGFWLLSRISHRWSKLWLCLASLVFYGWWEVKWVPVLLISIIFNYVIGYTIIARANAGKESGGLLLVGVGANLLALVYYKYLFATLSFFALQGMMYHVEGLPLGISFFTFTQIAFLVDVNQGFKGRYTPTNYLLFVTFFPHLIAGPIVHHRDLMPQFEEEKNYHVQPREIAIGLAIFAIGLAKKTLIADNASEISIRLLSGESGSVTTAWVGALSYSMQLYFDFSGYSDMAIGLARLFGIKFPINFHSPYKATSIIDFWQRWHITLTRFLTAYLYNPIALALVRRRARKGLSTSKRVSRSLRGFLELIALPTFVTMLLAGVWHGAGLQFVVFGALHGFYISANHAWRTFGPKEEKAPGPVLRIARTLGYGAVVYLCVLVAQIFFRAESVDGAVRVLTHMIVPGAGVTGPDTPVVGLYDIAVLAGAMAIAWFASNTQQIMADYDPALELDSRTGDSRIRARLSLGWAIIFGVVLFLGLIAIRDGQPFIYFQF